MSIALSACSQTKINSVNDKKINYFALGDSYTICEGANTEESWPVILCKNLTEKGIAIELIANPAKTGYTTQNLIDIELPLFETSEVDFTTLCIGVNDWVQKVDTGTFHKNLIFILDKVQNHISDKSKIILLSIPDFSATPNGGKYSGGRDISKGLSEFNDIIFAEAKKRNIKTVDLFEVSKGMKDDASLVAADGLHPSAKEYALWEKLILPVAEELLKK